MRHSSYVKDGQKGMAWTDYAITARRDLAEKLKQTGYGHFTDFMRPSVV